MKVTVSDRYPPLGAIVAETIDVPALFIVVLLPVIEITVGLVRTLYDISHGLSFVKGARSKAASP